ncbi:Maf family nucleotide pyrophosphatase [Suttonella sp. R2A3]|uniref:Maf family protein n=1 Tax=Suttonella sp. R2A3 TaxID=2908648 RepID=UPI001F1752AF|nr:nucleoside triphosphate pyrophosphatase [Suttonella sp. R2A3]UJF24887.1 Maf family nucleotide pyrophosphatase [Suttonella sp. R2A3]
MHIILASTSPYRRHILHNLRLNVRTAAPNIDETPLEDEPPQALVARLAALKAQAIEAPESAFVIGSDQVATLDNAILGKPHTVERAQAQLQKFSGREVVFYTGLCVRQGTTIRTIVEPFSVQFRELDQATIERYIALEKPLDCAGSFKSEGLGIHLFSALNGRDPNALIGLPTIALGELFREYGVDLLALAE